MNHKSYVLYIQDPDSDVERVQPREKSTDHVEQRVRKSGKATTYRAERKMKLILKEVQG